MMRIPCGTLVTITLLMAGGCQQDESLPSDGAPAEIPGPGPAVDPGPAPGGQTEPPIEDTTEERPAPIETEDAHAPGDSSEDAVSLRIQSWEETEKLIASHHGKVVIVDFWSTSCPPCRREFPHLVDLHQAHLGEVACVSVSLDYSGRASRPPEFYQERVHRFLAEQRATFENVLNSDDPDELHARLKLAPIPLVWVYDRQGNLVRQFDNTDPNREEFTYVKDVVPFAESLLVDN